MNHPDEIGLNEDRFHIILKNEMDSESVKLLTASFRSELKSFSKTNYLHFITNSTVFIRWEMNLRPMKFIKRPSESDVS